MEDETRSVTEDQADGAALVEPPDSSNELEDLEPIDGDSGAVQGGSGATGDGGFRLH